MNLSVAICTYNHSRLLSRALDSLARQEWGDGLAWELVVVDNNSTDDTRQKAESFASRLPLRYVFEPTQGLTQARRRAVRETAAEWLALVDDDCYLAPTWLGEAVRFCRDKPNAGAVGGRVRLAWEVSPNPLARRYERSLAGQDYGDEPRMLPAEGFTYLVGAGLVIRRSALEASGWLEQSALKDRHGRRLDSGGDSEMVLMIRNAGYELWYNPALELSHWIPKRRMTLPYLCRLLRGMGQSQVYLNRLGQPENESRPIQVLAASLGYFGRTAREALREIRWFRKLSPEQRVELYYALGHVEGAVDLLWRRNARG